MPVYVPLPVQLLVHSSDRSVGCAGVYPAGILRQGGRRLQAQDMLLRQHHPVSIPVHAACCSAGIHRVVILPRAARVVCDNHVCLSNAGPS